VHDFALCFDHHDGFLGFFQKSFVKIFILLQNNKKKKKMNLLPEISLDAQGIEFNGSRTNKSQKGQYFSFSDITVPKAGPGATIEFWIRMSTANAAAVAESDYPQKQCMDQSKPFTSQMDITKIDQGYISGNPWFVNFEKNPDACRAVCQLQSREGMSYEYYNSYSTLADYIDPATGQRSWKCYCSETPPQGQVSSDPNVCENINCPDPARKCGGVKDTKNYNYYLFNALQPDGVLYRPVLGGINNMIGMNPYSQFAMSVKSYKNALPRTKMWYTRKFNPEALTTDPLWGFTDPKYTAYPALASDETEPVATDPFTFSDEKWHHVAISTDGGLDETSTTKKGFMKAYFDGKLLQRLQFSVEEPGLIFNIFGKNHGVNPEFFKGEVSHVMIWNKPRTRTQIVQDMTLKDGPIPSSVSEIFDFLSNNPDLKLWVPMTASKVDPATKQKVYLQKNEVMDPNVYMLDFISSDPNMKLTMGDLSLITSLKGTQGPGFAPRVIALLKNTNLNAPVDPALVLPTSTDFTVEILTADLTKLQAIDFTTQITDMENKEASDYIKVDADETSSLFQTLKANHDAFKELIAKAKTDNEALKTSVTKLIADGNTAKSLFTSWPTLFDPKKTAFLTAQTALLAVIPTDLTTIDEAFVANKWLLISAFITALSDLRALKKSLTELSIVKTGNATIKAWKDRVAEASAFSLANLTAANTKIQLIHTDFEAFKTQYPTEVVQGVAVQGSAGSQGSAGTPNGGGEANVDPLPDAKVEEKKPMSTGVIVGITLGSIGGFALLCVVIALIVHFFNHRTPKKEE
jgi:hypothetical protein